MNNHTKSKPRKWLPIILLGAAILVGSWIGYRTLTQNEPTDLPNVTSNPNLKEQFLKVYLMQAPGIGCEEKSQPVIQAMLQDIQNAKTSIHLAIYSFSLDGVGGGLIQAKQHGVSVELVMESDNMDGSLVEELQQAGIPIHGDKVKSLMHDKFMVIDGKTLWTGSMNLTPTSLCEDLNDMVRVNDPYLSATYDEEFSEMFDQGLFSWKSPKNPGTIPAVIDSHSLGVYFSPEDHVQQQILDMIGIAQSSIEFFGYSFTADPLADALIEQSKEGVVVRGVMDAVQAASNIGTDYDRFRQTGLDVRLASTIGAMHHKVFIIDGQIVILGSYNFTKSAEEDNDENILVIHNPDIAQQFLAEFERIFATAKP